MGNLNWFLLAGMGKGILQNQNYIYTIFPVRIRLVLLGYRVDLQQSIALHTEQRIKGAFGDFAPSALEKKGAAYEVQDRVFGQ